MDETHIQVATLSGLVASIICDVESIESTLDLRDSTKEVAPALSQMTTEEILAVLRGQLCNAHERLLTLCGRVQTLVAQI